MRADALQALSIDAVVRAQPVLPVPSQGPSPSVERWAGDRMPQAVVAAEAWPAVAEVRTWAGLFFVVLVRVSVAGCFGGAWTSLNVVGG